MATSPFNACSERASLRHLFFSFIILTIALAVLFSNASAGKAKIKKGSTPPDVEWTTVAGEHLSWDQLRGEGPLVVFFWATWCKVCKKSIPRLNELAHKYDSYTDPPAWASISLGEPPEKVEKAAVELNLPAPWIADPEEKNGKILGINYVPTICLLDRDGAVAYWGKSDLKKLDQLLKKLAGEPIAKEESP